MLKTNKIETLSSMAVIIDRSLFRFTCTCCPCQLPSKRTPRKQSDPQHMSDEDTRVKFDVQAMCFDCCKVLVVGLSPSSDMFKCCHRCSMYVSSCLRSPAQHRFGQTPRQLDCTTAHMLQYHLEFVCLVRQFLMSSPDDGEEVDDCCATMLAATLFPFATTSGFVQYGLSWSGNRLCLRL